MAEPSHKDCIHREDYDALMRIMNYARGQNFLLARELEATQAKLRTLEALLPREEAEPPNDD